MKRISEKQKNQAYDFFKKGYSLKEIAEKIGVSYSTICKWADIEHWREKNLNKNPFNKINRDLYKVIQRRKKMTSDLEELAKLEELQEKFYENNQQQA